MLVGTVLGRNIDVAINQWLAYGLHGGRPGRCSPFIQTDANIFDFSHRHRASSSMVVGLVLLMAGMYGKVGTEEEAEACQKARLVL